MQIFMEVSFIIAEDWKKPCLSTNRQNIVYACDKMLFSCKREWTTDTCYSMDES